MAEVQVPASVREGEPFFLEVTGQRNQLQPPRSKSTRTAFVSTPGPVRPGEFGTG